MEEIQNKGLTFKAWGLTLGKDESLMPQGLVGYDLEFYLRQATRRGRPIIDEPFAPT